MSEQRKMHLTAFMRPVSLHTGAWRYPGSHPDANFNLGHLKYFIQKLEAAKFDAFFMADHLAVLNMPVEALKRSHTTTSFEPFTLLSALSQVTEKIGLAATASTTYDEPYHIARRFASLDHLSNGRAAWNIVTTGNPESSKNFGQDEHMQHSDRYKRAREFYDVVTGLWDSFAGKLLLHVIDIHGLTVRSGLDLRSPPALPYACISVGSHTGCTADRCKKKSRATFRTNSPRPLVFSEILFGCRFRCRRSEWPQQIKLPGDCRKFSSVQT